MPDFIALFDRLPEVRADAPGRVNLIGEHTDYNGGYVLPVAIPQRTRVELASSPSNDVRAWSSNAVDLRPLAYELGAERPGRGWLDYVQGVSWALAAAGHAARGFDVRIESDVPLGSGLSSSAALEMSLLRALRSAFQLPLDDVQLALVARRGENDFVGAPVGIMDPIAASLADERTALFLDTRTLEYEPVPLPASAGIVILDSKVTHHNAQGGYRSRREECVRASRLLGVAALCDLPATALDRVTRLPAPLDRRARHVVTEHARVVGAVHALRAGDLVSAGHLFNGSHVSMRDDFEVSVPEVDQLVELACSEEGVYGARLTGGGFGGSVVLLVRRGDERKIAGRVTTRYFERTGRSAAVHLPWPFAA